MCDVELGIFFMQEACPHESVDALPTLLGGYPFQLSGEGADAGKRRLGICRHLLPPYKNPQSWRRALGGYETLPQWVRGYEFSGDGRRIVRREVSDAPRRWEAYESALRGPLRHRDERLRLAQPGAYLAHTRRGATTVTIPEDLPLPDPTPGHRIDGATRTAEPLEVEWEALRETARWMDEELDRRGLAPSSWEARLRRVRLETLDRQQETFARAEALRIERVLHLVGMVSSGKSTLMDVLAVWAARNGMRATVVVGDVVGAVRRTTLFRSLGIEAVPILGRSNRARHADRLHKVLRGEAGASILEHEDPGFDFLSTACGLDGLREGTKPFAPGDTPCVDLEEPEPEDEALEDDGVVNSRRVRSSVRLGCPLFASCQQHRASRELVRAPIWVATPASLVYTLVPAQVNAERIRYAELVYRTSDLVVVDEADQVQVQLDLTFSPSESLIGGRRDSWFDDLDAQVGRELRRFGRAQLGEATVSAWVNAFDVARAAGNRLYALLNQEAGLRRELRRDHFTEWSLAVRLAEGWTRPPDRELPRTHPPYVRVLEEFEAFIRDPVGSKGVSPASPLTVLARQVLTVPDEGVVRRELRAWLVNQQGLEVSDDELDAAVLRLEFVLVLAVLADRLEILIRLWSQVEGPLNLDGNSLLFHRPPTDYSPIVPEAPMGNQLGFQYLDAGDVAGPERAGELRFFRCMGVGRWVLLRLHELFAFDGIPGPNVLLLSGTSWAGSSPNYDVQVPVGGILRAPDREVEAVAQSTFRFLPLTDEQQQAVRVSGRYGGGRRVAIRDLLAGLCRRTGLGNRPSLLERELEELPADRRRVLLLVGSYEEARNAQEDLLNLRPDWRGEVLRLRADADEDGVGVAWVDDPGSIRRGDVERFANTGAVFLIAPLLAVERGHNILNEQDEAAIGAAYFLVRPHPRPDDIGFAIHSINRWAVERAERLASETRSEIGPSLAERGSAFRKEAYGEWRRLLSVPLIYRTMSNEDREAQAWSQLVGIWQVIGRLVRGGCPARVYFCDAAFAPRSADREKTPDDERSSLLVGIHNVLRPYFVDGKTSPVPREDRTIVRILYGPLYEALAGLKGVSRAGL